MTRKEPLQKYLHQFKPRPTVGISAIILLLASASISSAQIQSQFGQELLQRRQEEPAAFEPKLTVDYQAGNVFNNHLEFGLSIDPNTSSLAGRENPQLQGMINQAGVNLQGTLPLGKRFGLKLQYQPQLENYIGEDGQLNEFDAFTDVFLTELSFRPTPALPPLSVSHQLQRLDRKDDTYDSLQRQIGFRLGKLLEYNFRIRHFDDDRIRREDFLLVGSTSHQASARVQLGFLRNVLGRLEYSIERESYENNLNTLVLGIAGIKPGESRTDMRHFASAKWIEVPTNRLVLQEEFNLFLSNSDADFYDFSSIEVAIGAFFKIKGESWARLRLSRLNLDFNGRRVFSGGAENRVDDQTHLNFRLNWQLHNHLALLADYQLINNNTNEKAEIFDFLNYTNNIVSLTIQATY